MPKLLRLNHIPCECVQFETDSVGRRKGVSRKDSTFPCWLGDQRALTLFILQVVIWEIQLLGHRSTTLARRYLTRNYPTHK